MVEMWVLILQSGHVQAGRRILGHLENSGNGYVDGPDGLPEDIWSGSSPF